LFGDGELFAPPDAGEFVVFGHTLIKKSDYIQMLRKGEDESEKSAERMRRSLQTKFINSLSNSFQDVFEDILKNGELNWQSMLDTFMDLAISFLTELVARFAATKIAVSVGLAAPGAAAPFGAALGSALPIAGAAILGGLALQEVLGPDDTVRTVFLGTINSLTGAVDGLSSATASLAAAVGSIRATMNAIQLSTGGRLTGFPTSFSVSERGGQFIASDPTGVLQGKGSSIDEALDDLFRKWLAFTKRLAAEGLEVLQGLPKLFKQVVLNSTANTLEELAADLDLAANILAGSRTQLRTEIFNSINEMNSAIMEAIRLGIDPEIIKRFGRNAIRDSINALAGEDIFLGETPESVRRSTEDLRKAVFDLNLTYEETIKLLDRVNLAEEIRMKTLENDVLQRLVNIISKIPKLQEKAAALQAKIDQARFLIDLEIIKIQLKAFDLLNKEFRQMLRMARRFGRDVNNFIENTVNATAKATKDIVEATGNAVADTISETITPTRSGNRKAKKEADKALKERILDLLAQFELTPLELSIKGVVDQFKEAIENAKRLGIEEERVLEARAKAIGQIKTEFLQPLVDFRDSLEEQAADTPLSKFHLLLERFNAIRDAALSGDEAAISDFPGVAQDLLNAASGIFGTSGGFFQALLDQIQQDTNGVIDIAGDVFDDAVSQLIEIDQQILDELKRVGDLLAGNSRAVGGTVRKNVGYIVGEGGEPEVFFPNQDGSVVPFSRFAELRVARGMQGSAIQGGMSEVAQFRANAAREQEESRRTSEIKEIKEEVMTLTSEMRRFTQAVTQKVQAK
jgi:SLT domain-containing protein